MSLQINKAKPYDSKTDQIVKILREEILDASLKPQERIIEEDISRRFKVSRAPVREAFRTLESLGLINIIPRKGVWVADINIEDIIAIYKVRPMLEGLAAKLACRNATDEDIECLAEYVAEMQRATKIKDYQLYFKLNKDFHNRINSLAQNKYLNQFLMILNDNTRYRYLSLVLLKRVQTSHKSHMQLLDAFRAKDDKKAERIRKNRVARVGQDLIKVMSIKY